MKKKKKVSPQFRKRPFDLRKKEYGSSFNLMQLGPKRTTRQLVKKVLQEINSSSTTTWDPVFFNNKQNDPHRFQFKLKLNELNLFPYLSELKVLAEKKLSQVYCDYCFMDVVSILKSLPGGEKQILHSDYDESDEKFLKNPPFSAIISLTGGARLDFENMECTEVKSCPNLKSGEMLTFFGFSKHRGIGYSQTNIRVHFYCTHKDIPPEKYSDSTYF